MTEIEIGASAKEPVAGVICDSDHAFSAGYGYALK